MTLEGLNVVLWHAANGEWWEGQIVEYDLAAQARTLPDVWVELERTLAVHLAINQEAGEPPPLDLPPAPARFAAVFAG
jgi:hypothetical protein